MDNRQYRLINFYYYYLVYFNNKKKIFILFVYLKTDKIMRFVILKTFKILISIYYYIENF